ncbi:MAG: hypothetical protein KJ624_06075 [Chloroflexi bacterium]|nr:hypothetical protein [Chloroflexota bacterium]
MRKLNIALVLAALLVLGAGGGIMAQTPTPTPAITQVVGAITLIAGSTVTIDPDGDAAAIVLNVTASTEIEVPGKDEATIADLLAGDRVKAKYETASLNALEIEVEAAKVQGEITALDATATPKKVTIKPKTGDAVVLTVTAMTELEVWGKEPAEFADLKVGQWAKAEYNATSNEAYEIEVRGKGEPSLAVRHGYFGTVKAKDDTPPTLSLTLDTKQGEVVLTLDADTQYWDPPKRDATLADVNVGDRVAVLAQDSLAKRVLVIPAKPAKPVRLQVSATVTAVDGNVITLKKGEETFTVELPAGLAAQVQVGDVLTIALLRTPGVEKYLASGMMKDEQLRERLDSFGDKVKSIRPRNDEERGRQSQDLEKLGNLLRQNMDRHEDMMNKVMEKAPSQAREALQKAMENSRQGWEQALAALNKDKTPTPTFRVR